MVLLGSDVKLLERPEALRGETLPEIKRQPVEVALHQPNGTEMADVRVAVQNPAAATLFATMFVDGYLTPAFGARTKSEIDLLVLGCMIKAGVLNPGAPIYDLARALNLTPTRVRSLLLNWQLRSGGHSTDMRRALIATIGKTRFMKDGTLLTFGIENPLLREEVDARLKRRGVFADASFSREIVRLPLDTFAEFLDDLVDETTKRDVRSRLVEDHQLPDKSFKALVAGLLGKIGEKVAGKAGEAIVGEFIVPFGSEGVEAAADRLGAFLSSLLRSDTPAAVAALRPRELSV